MTTTTVTTEQIKELRNLSGASMMDCRKALVENNGDIQGATDWLRQKGITKADKKSGRSTQEGLIDSYIHNGSKVGVLIEVNCETDFVAKNDVFKELTQNLCIQVASMSPAFISRDEVTQDILDKELIAYKEAAIEDGKPENIAEKIAQGKVDKYFEERCLLHQPYIFDDSMSVEDYIKSMIAKTGENIRIARFTRFVLGE